MDPAYYVAAGSLKARSFQLETVANNLANADTVGFKTERSFFSLFNKAVSSSRDLPMTKYVNDGTVLAQRGIDFSQGVSRPTGRNLDVAISGNGFLVVQTPGGTRVTRDGRLQLGAKNQLETLDGNPVLGKNGQPITLNPAQGQITITADGTLQQGVETVGQLDMKAYENPTALNRMGSNLYDPSGLKETTPKATLAQGYLEQSAVDVSSEMVKMIQLNRLYEMSLKVASALSNDMDASTISNIANQR